jgi:hypothetical protein
VKARWSGSALGGRVSRERERAPLRVRSETTQIANQAEPRRLVRKDRLSGASSRHEFGLLELQLTYGLPEYAVNYEGTAELYSQGVVYQEYANGILTNIGTTPGDTATVWAHNGNRLQSIYWDNKSPYQASDRRRRPQPGSRAEVRDRQLPVVDQLGGQSQHLRAYPTNAVRRLGPDPRVGAIVVVAGRARGLRLRPREPADRGVSTNS